MDRDPKHLQEIVRRAEHHHGAAFVEIYQNCNVFNDGAFALFTEKGTREDHVVYLEHGKPLLFGAARDKGIVLDGFKPTVVTLADGKNSVNDVLVHDERDSTLAFILANMIHNPALPRPMGVFMALDRPAYEEMLQDQVARAKNKKGEGNLQKLLDGEETWMIQ
jgi:2-oxoglutarate ferredoxin oxidoreductase subunit beta